MKKRTQYTPVSLSAVGLQLSYQPPARTVEQAKQQPASAGVVPPSKQTPRAFCPNCKGRWEILEGSPLLKWRRYRLRPDTECPQWSCRSTHMSLGWCPIVDMYGGPHAARTPEEDEWTRRELGKYHKGIREGELVQRHLGALCT
jgi:hypothetical protein